MRKYHISEDGLARVCKAQKKKCTLAHGNTPEEAMRADEEMKYSQGFSSTTSLSKKKTNSRVDKHEKNVYDEDMTTTQTLDQATETIVQKIEESDAKKKIVLADVDGTLVKGSLVLQHAVWLAERGHAPEVFTDLPQRWLADQKNEELIGQLGPAYQKSLTGMHIDEIGLDEYLDPVLDNRNNFYSTIDRLNQMKGAGARVVLISGSPDFMIKKMADKFGFEGVGSGYTIDHTSIFQGKVHKPMFNAAAKREHIATLNLNDDYYVTGFGDTSSDLPIFEVADHSVLVAPNEYTQKKIGHMVDEIIQE